MNTSDYLNFDLTISYVELALTKKCPLKWEIKKESRSTYGLVYISAGEADFIFNDECFHSQTDDIVYLRKGCSYTIKSSCDVPLEFIVISFGVEKECHIPFEIINKAGHTRRFYEMFKYTEDIFVGRGIAYKLYCRSMVEQIIYHLISERFCAVKPLDKLQASVSFIENYYDQKIDIDSLASVAGLSVSHYRKVFKEIYGIPPIEYVNKIRVEKAKSLLKSGLYSQIETAEQCGFDNVQYFSRVFKKFTGFTPGTY